MSWHSFGVNVIITNKMPNEIKNVEIKFTGGTITVQTIKPGIEYQTSVQPTGESHLELRYTDASGKDHDEIIGVYFEQGYKGEILIDITPDGTAHFQDKIYLRVSWNSKSKNAVIPQINNKDLRQISTFMLA